MADRRIKQVILYRRDLKMRKGKIAAQVAHASLKVVLAQGRFMPLMPNTMMLQLTPDTAEWVRRKFTKVVLSVENEDDLVRAWELAKEHDLPTTIITDSGRTEFGGVPTRTTVAIGPAEAGAIDAITGKDGMVATRLA